MKKIVVKKAKSGLGMKSVKSGYDDNSGVTRADFVAIGKGTAKSGASVKKAQYGNKTLVNYKDNPGYKALMEKEKNKSKASKNSSKPKMKSGGSMKKCKYGCK